MPLGGPSEELGPVHALAKAVDGSGGGGHEAALLYPDFGACKPGCVPAVGGAFGHRHGCLVHSRNAFLCALESMIGMAVVQGGCASCRTGASILWPPRPQRIAQPAQDRALPVLPGRRLAGAASGSLPCRDTCLHPHKGNNGPEVYLK